MTFLRCLTALAVTFSASAGFTLEADSYPHSGFTPRLTSKIEDPNFKESFEKTTTLESAIACLNNQFQRDVSIIFLFEREVFYAPLLPHLQGLANHIEGADKTVVNEEIRKKIYTQEQIRKFLGMTKVIYINGKPSRIFEFLIGQFVNKIFDPTSKVYEITELLVSPYHHIIQDLNDYLEKKKTLNAFLANFQNFYKYLDADQMKQLITDIVAAIEEDKTLTLHDCKDVKDFAKLVDDINNQRQGGGQLLSKNEYHLLVHRISMRFMNIENVPLKERLMETLDLMWGNPYSIDWYKVLLAQATFKESSKLKPSGSISSEAKPSGQS